MKLRASRLTAWLFVASCFFACSPERSAGGGGFEGETLTGIVRHDGGTLAGAKVTFIPLGSREAVGSATTDASGKFSLQLPSGTSGFLEARSGDTALVRQLLEQIPKNELALDAPAAVPWKARIVVDDLPASGAILHIRGSTNSIVCDARGGFTMFRLRSGREWARLETTTGLSRDITLPPVSDTLLEIPRLSHILLDDFEGSEGRSTLGDALGSGWWYALTDTAQGGQSSILPADAIVDIRKGFSTFDAWKGTSLSLQLLVDQTRPVYYAIFGTVLTEAPLWMDLSKVDSISFMAKGSGNLRLVFVTQASLEPTLDPNGYFGTDIALPSNWARVIVRKSQISAPTFSRPYQQGMSWTSACTRVRNIAFVAQDTATVQIDDIVLHGPELSDLMPKR